jgi:acyl-CoA reductase-like NAD-dependent aldehyde dehydrogenase
MTEQRNLVGGSLVRVGPGADAIVNPTTEEVLGHSAHASASVVEAAIEAADVAYRDWRRSTPLDRATLLHALADRMEAAAPELALLETDNVGMPIRFSEAIVEASVDALRFFAGAARTMSGLPTAEYVEGMTSFLRREPIGVVGQLLPWNVPLLMAAWKIGPALAAGNTVIVKPSRRTPLTLLRFCEIAMDVIPAGVVNVVTGTHEEVVGTLARSPIVRMMALTGSVAAGVSVTTQAAPTVKRLHLELGGNTPVIVCADADLATAAERIVSGALDNSGQDCTAASRVLVQSSIADRLTEGLIDHMSKVKIGDPRDRATEMGPVISEDRREAILAMIERGREEGAELVHGGRALPRTGYFLEPAILLDPEGTTSITNQEIFGPVITVERWTDEDEAVARVNASDYGLACGVWTSSMSRALSISGRLEAGKVWINEHHRDATEMPHGGVKRSGYGSDLSVLAVHEYTTAKAVHARFA